MRPVMFLCALLFLCGCDRAATSDAPDGVVNLTVRDYRYDHQDVRVRRGAVTFDVTNAGSEETNFRVRRRKRDLASIATLEPGEYGTTTVSLRPGTYVMYSSVGRHEVLGEYGTLTVVRR
jgi:Cupredoxin-like domain